MAGIALTHIFDAKPSRYSGCAGRKLPVDAGDFSA
jgi:hypothetical protein